MKFAIAVLLSSYAVGQIEQPRIGVMLNRDGSARPVLGMAGSTTLGDAAANGVISSSCAAICLFKTDSAIVSATGSVGAPPGPALFSFTSDSVLVYFPRARKLARWHSDQLDPVSLTIPGDILAMGNNSFVVRRPGGVWIVNSADQPVGSLPFETTAALLLDSGGSLDSGVLYATPSELIIRRPDQSLQIFSISGVTSLSYLGQNYVQVHTRDANYALRIDPGHERAFLLPEPQ